MKNETNTMATKNDNGATPRFSQRQLQALCSDIDSQPKWRDAANKACAYYDGDQLPPEVLQVLKDRGQPMTIHNLIAPTVDGVLGMEAKTRTDLVVMSDEPDDETEKLAEAINAEFADACRLGNMNKARSDAYAEQIKAGLSWVEVRRNSDPFGPEFKVSTVSRKEVFWDWLSREADLSDCRWLMRRRWMDTDEAKATFPGMAQVIDYAIDDWRGFVDTTVTEGQPSPLMSAWEEYQSWDRKENEWLQRERRRVLLQVVYYRTFERLPVIELSNGRVVAFDKNNLMHAVAVASGRVQVRVGRVSRIREAWFVGPHFIVDRPCSAPQGMFPLVPFWGYRKDKTGEPYGLISRAIPAQDEVNFRRIKLTWLLQAKRVIMDEDATQLSDNELMEQIERPDGIIKLNPARKNQKSVADVFRVEQDFQVASQQFQVMQESEKLIQDTMGVYSAFLGQDSNASSGVAISNLVEQGATTLAEINDNYQFACQQVGRLLLAYLLDGLKKRRNHAVVINRDDRQRRQTIVLNAEGDNGELTNDISRLNTHIALAPVQQTPAFKAQLAQRMSEVIQGLPPQVQAVVLDLWVNLLDVPQKQEFVERIRAALGTPKSPDEMTPEEQQAAQQQQAQEQQQQELQMREMAGRVAKLEAEAARAQAAAQRDNAGAQRDVAAAQGQRYVDALNQAHTAEIITGIQNMEQEQEVLQQQMLHTLQQRMHEMPL
ncbi:portal protein [Escherichia coli]|uniref:Putative portal protein n=2 Tax=Escherichia coli TaxID=562 RepID=A0A0E0Y2K8_ECO1C|nr:portal protein [Escherichia coli]HDQ6478825.1 portal protein [Escherichia coli O104:H4 str. 11-3798]AFS57184.1 putative portal protein [Escherichia coli O104:H4 str. 2009EL-2050]AFS74396.1 putative portal protein [Escherichia coli O104:H4 str. 2011C-3493]AFS86372.1 putative portal protein [Escherichia coli O104:H4 str. 2009EL-2071]AKE84348.1 portal protein [Escherichia coli O104:H4 str. C227-11]